MIGRNDEGPVLIAEDDPTLLSDVRDALSAAGLPAIIARSARIAREALAFHRPPVVLLDLAMEEGRGWELLFEVAKRPGTSVLALDRRGDSVCRRGALAAGADDVMGPPFEPEELAARARAVGRRHRVEPDRVLRHRDVVLDVASHEVQVAGRPVSLTPQQFALLRALFEAGGATLHRKQLLARIASIDGEPPSDRAVDLHMSRLRRRLGSVAGGYIEAVYGLGYRLVAPAPDRDAPGTAADPILDALDEAVIVTDAQLRIVSANGAARRLLGRGRADLVGRACSDVMHCRTCDGVPLGGPACIGRAVMAGGGTIGHVSLVVSGAEAAVPVSITHAAIRAAGADPLLAIELRPAD